MRSEYFDRIFLKLSTFIFWRLSRLFLDVLTLLKLEDQKRMIFIETFIMNYSVKTQLRHGLKIGTIENVEYYYDIKKSTIQSLSCFRNNTILCIDIVSRNLWILIMRFYAALEIFKWCWPKVSKVAYFDVLFEFHLESAAHLYWEHLVTEGTLYVLTSALKREYITYKFSFCPNWM